MNTQKSVYEVIRENIKKDSSGGLFMNTLEKLLALYDEYEALKEERDRIIKELNSLASLNGTLVFKWVRNKVGKVYYYWYLHIKDKGKTRSIYIGRELPSDLMKSIEDKVRRRLLEVRLKNVSSRIIEIEDKIKAVLQILR